MRWRFGAFLLDDEGYRLTRAGEPVALRRKVFDLLVLLVRERERVVPREELVERLWSTTAVGAGSLSGLVNELRSALGEGGQGGSSIRTVHARGYQFVAPLASAASLDGPGTETGTGTGPETEPDAGVSPAWGRAGARLEGARRVVGRSGARALAAAVADPTRRARWLAAMLALARDAGFAPRFEVVTGERGDRSIGAGLVPLAFEVVAPVGAAAGAAPGGDGGRAPIALGLEIQEPGTWARAGGLARLLDLLGGAPVLVIAGLAAPIDEARAHGLLVRDARIEWAGEAEIEAALGGGAGEVDGRGPGGQERLAAILHALAAADETALVAALRRLGFEVIRPEPIRSLRRVAAQGDPAVGRRRAEGA